MTDKKFPNPEEIQKEFEDFVQKRFGGQVQVISQEFPFKKKVEKEELGGRTAKAAGPIQFHFTPKEIKAHLDRFVISQDEAKKALAIAVCDHYNHVMRFQKSADEDYLHNYSKQNVMILGPTGVGKTYLVRQIAKLIGVPFVRADATKFSETGYMGANVDDLVKDLVAQADGDIERAKFGIVYIDEIDKLASAQGHVGRDISGRGVQLGLLKLMEETDVDLRSSHDPASQMQAFLEMQQKGKVEKQVVNTRFILFIVSGAFPDLENIVSKRLSRNKIGFTSPGVRSIKDEKTELLQRATTQDFVQFGFEPEFIGRLPVRVACVPLEKPHLVAILKNKEGSILSQYQESFAAYDIDLQFTDDAIEKIADLALEEKTGARALMTVCEKILRNFKFELPSSGVYQLTVDQNLIEAPQVALSKLLERVPQSARTMSREIRNFEKDFFRNHDMHIRFAPDACSLIMEKSATLGMDITNFCTQTLVSFEHGLKLIEQNTSQKEFILDRNVVENPKAALEKMVKDSYNVV